MRLFERLRKCRWALITALGLIPVCALAEAAPGVTQVAAPSGEGQAFDIARVALPPAKGMSGVVAIDIAIDDAAAIGMERTPYWLLYAAGAASVPMSVLNPFYGLGVFYPIIGTPMNAVFNARREALAAGVKAEPLPEKMLAILMELLEADPSAVPSNIDVKIARYGLVARSGKPIAVLTPGDELCLAAHASLAISRAGAPRVDTTIVIGMEGQDIDAPPPICASIAQFAKDDAIYLRQAIRELAEVLSAIVFHRLKAPS